MTDLLKRISDLSPEKRQLLLRRLAQEKPAPAVERIPCLPRTDSQAFPLSFSQQRLWFLDQLEPGSAAYNIPTALHLVGRLDAAALARSFGEIVRRHEVLRTTFAVHDGVAVQIVSPPHQLALTLADLGALPAAWRETEAGRLAREEARLPFDLERGPLLRARLLRLGEEDYMALLTLHHIASDGWSTAVLVRELSTLYAAFAAGRPSPLPELPVQYADFAVWQRQWLAGESADRHLEYWRGRLAGAPPLLELPTDRPRPKVRGDRGEALTFTLPAELGVLCQRGQATLFMVLLAGFTTLLHRLSGREDVVVGSPIANRRDEVEGLIGFFVNTLVLRSDLSGDPAFQEHLGRIRAAALEAYAHQDLPFERLVDELQMERSLRHTPLFQVMLTLQNTPQQELRLPGLAIQGLGVDSGTSKFDLELLVVESPGRLQGTLTYSTELFDRSTALRMRGQLESLLGGALALPERRLSDLPLLSEPELHQALLGWNDTAEGWRFGCVHGDFEQRAARAPEVTALSGAGGEWTYAEVERLANRLSRVLARLGAGPERLTALLVDRGLGFLAPALALLKLGGAFLPLDDSYPPARLRQVLEQSGTPLLVVAGRYAGLLGEALEGGLDRKVRARVVPLEDLVAAAEEEDGAPPSCICEPERLAYVIYTSGSTGTPKGAMLTYRGLWSHLQAKIRQFGLAADDVVGQTAPLTFDISVWQFLAALLVGGRVHVFAEDLAADPALMMGEVERAGISILETGPTQLAILLDEAERRGPAATPLRWLLVSGEALPPALCARWLALHPGVPLVNAYGATECSDDVTHQTLREPLPPQALHTPLGQPSSDSTLYILDRLSHPVPIGVAGEIHLGGICVGRGYFRDPVRTAAAFVPDPFSSEPGRRLYRTGDLGRYRADGNSEFLGRIDFQVKVRGFRIELGEIETALAAHPAVGEAVVLARRDGPGEARLIAYVVPQGEPPGIGELRAFVGQRLPEYMVPSTLLVLESWPLTPNGKLDRKALPAPGPERPELERPYEAPRGPAEAALAAIWEEVLHLDRVGVHDNFFELGGDSILTIQIVSRAKTAGLTLTPKLLFEHQTVAELAARVEAAAAGAAAVPEPPARTPAKQRWREELDPRLLKILRARGWEIEDLYPLAPTQSGMLFFHLLEPEAHPFFEQASWRLHGSLDPAALRAAWEALLVRHPVFRTCFYWEGLAEPVQIVLRNVDLAWEEQDWRHLASGEWDARVDAFLRADRRRGLDLSRAPLMRLSLIRLGAESWQLTWSWHHIILDGWSSTTITREGLALYDALRAGREARLEERRPYGEYVAWLMEQDLGAAERFWRRELAGYTAPLRLAFDRAPGTLPKDDAVYRGEDLFLGAGASASLRTLARRSQVTLNTVFQGVWALLLARYGGTEDVVFGVTSSGRPPDLPGVESMVGLFLLTLPMRMRVTPETPWPGWLRGIQERQVELRQYEYTSLVQVRGWSEVPPELPLFETFLVFQNFPDVSAEQWRGRDLQVSEGRGYDRASDPLLLVVAPHDEIVLRISYDTDRFDSLAIQRLARQLPVLLEAVATIDEGRLCDLPLLTPAERHQALLSWNDTATGWELGCLHRAFEAHAARRPGAVALVAAGQEWTYAELSRRADRLARFLARRGVGPEDLVALMVDRGPAFLTAALALSKAGAAFLPLDSRQPPARTAQILAGAAPALLLVEGDRSALISELSLAGDGGPRWQAVALEPILAREWGDEELPCRCHPQGLAYVIYTSGSTGVPKGAMIELQGMMNHLWDKVARFELTESSAVAQTAPLTFDIAVWEFLAVLLAGGRTHVVADEAAQDPVRLMREVEEAGISVLETGPSLLAVLVEEVARVGEGRSRVEELRWLLVSGEALPPALCARWLALYPHVPLVNAYGATECSDDVTHVAIREPLPEALTASPLGAPLPGSALYVLDGELRPLPVGVPGEIYLGGICVGRGYRNDPQRTAEAFVPDPFSALPGRRFYRTGDLGRYLPDGNAEFLGRIDFQVKVRGFRIELGEIEAVLSLYPRVQQAVVLAREARGGDSLLIAYVLVEEVPGPYAGELAAFLRERLPDYMMPAVFVALDAFPLTVNGKVDRRRLPSPDALSSVRTASRPPRTRIEEMLVAIWKEVLGHEDVGVFDDFFHLGGHSLKAIQVASRLRQALGSEVPLRWIFERPVLADLAAGVEAAVSAGGRREAPPLVPVPRDRPLPLSFAQQRLWFLDQLEPGSAAYNTPAAVRFLGPLDLGVLARCFTELVRRHEVLRTTFPASEGEPVQAIAPPAAVPLPVLDLDGLAEEPRAAEALRLASEEARRPFDLAQGPLFRAAVLRLSAEDHVVLASTHHIVSDGWSSDIFNREVAALYAAFCNGLPSPLPELPVQYADYSCWQREWLRGEVLEEELAYWRERLRGAPPALQLPTDRPQPAVPSFRGGTCPVLLPAGLSQELRLLARSEGTTLFVPLLAGFQALLSRYAGEPDISVGTPTAGRTRVEIEGLIGFFVNTLVLRTDLGDDPSFAGLMSRVRQGTLEAYEHQSVPFEKIVEELEPARSLSRTPLFQVMFALQNVPQEARPIEGLRIQSLGAESRTAKFDLLLAVTESEAGISGELEHSADLFDPATALRIAAHYQRLLAAAVAAPAVRLSGLSFLAAEEVHQVTCEWNDTAAERAWPAGVHQLFEAQAERAPEAPAVLFEGGSLTYGRLNRLANGMASRLRERGVGPDVRVGLCVERSPELAVSLLAILKAGGAYVPLDPTYPPERLSLMIEDAQVPLVLAGERAAGRLPATRAEILAVASDDGEPEEDDADRSPTPKVTGDSLAYVIYTSGSTGRPKGVAMPHRPLCNLILWQAVRSPVALRTLQLTSPSFDVSFQELFATWCVGGALVLVPEDERRDFQALGRRLAAVERVFMPYVALQQLAESLEPGGRMGLREVITAGEALQMTPALAALVEREGCALHNQYGPTESHVVTEHTVSRGATTLLPPIGRPIANARILLLDPGLHPVPVGVPGELYIGGPTLARGYLDRPGLTAERFVPDPFGAPGARLYRTGDRARFLADGNLEFLGRADQQVKIRGFRVEPGEVEAALSRHPSVRNAVVLAQDDGRGGRRLVAWLMTDGSSSDGFAAFLRDRLPDYMVPSVFVTVESFPRTPSGKVDRRALAALDPGQPAGAAAYVASRGPIEEILAEIWSEMLGVERVGVEDSFFDLGGHSLLATRVMARVRSSLGVDLPVRSLFESPTVASLARAVAGARAATGAPEPPLTARPRDGSPLPLSFAQQRLWLIDQVEPGSPLYNMPTAVLFEGPLEIAALAASLTEVVRRHEALRTRFGWQEGEPVQWVVPAGDFGSPMVDLSGLPEGARRQEAWRLAAAESERPFDLSRGPLFRAGLLRLAPHQHMVLVTMHHIVSDGWSLQVLDREVRALYAAFSRGEPSPLPELAIQYADYAVWQREWLQGEVLEAELSYWRERLRGAPPLLDLPADRPRPAQRSSRGSGRALALPEGLSQALRTLSRRGGATLYMTLLAGFEALLFRISGSVDFCVGTPVAGRTRTEVEALIGFFVNTLVLRADLSGLPGFRELLERVREVALQAQSHQHLPFDRLVEALQPERSLSYSPLFQVMFALYHLPQSSRPIEGLEGLALGVEGGTAKFDLALGVSDTGGALAGGVEYSSDLFDATTVSRLLEHFRSLLSAAVADPERPVTELPLLSEAEAHQLLWEWNDTAALPEEEICLHELFERQAARTLEAVAVVDGERRWTYRELDRQAGRLAHRLRSLGVGPEARVGICLERSAEMVAGLLAILKAGGAYVPLDPDYPAERLAFLIEDSGAVLVLTSESGAEKLPAGVTTLRLDALETMSGWEGPLPRTALPGNLAYAIYTSGSTGRPKGTLNSHRGIVNRLLWMQERYGLTSEDRVLQKTPYSFDVSVWEFFWPLLTGARLVMALPGGHREPSYLVRTIREEGITTIHFVPSMLQAFLEAPEVERCGSFLKRVVCSGEALPLELQSRFFTYLPDVELHNLYGPTEAAVDVTSWACQPGEGRPLVPIGRPVANTGIHVLDRELRPMPIGVAGELLIGGVQVGRGYLGRPELTAERFVPDPVSGQPGARLYRTGDLARLLSDGAVDFLGRIDHQVKVRGFRIELGEIESVLTRLPEVREAAVLARGDGRGGKSLAAFVVLEAGTPFDSRDLRRALGERLPEHMVPASLVALDALPLTANGKVDRRVLAALLLPGLERAERVAPRSLTEQLLAELWSQVLEVDEIGAKDNFFDLGGHSLLATRVISRIRQGFGVEIPVRRLFEAPTLAALAREVEAALRAGRTESGPLLRPAPRGPEPPLSFAQESLWFLDQLEPGSPLYNIPLAVRFEGELRAEVVARVLTEVVRRHETLRTIFALRRGGPVQVIGPPQAVPLPVVDLSGLAEELRHREAQRLAIAEARLPFDLAQGPLLRAGLLRLGEHDHAVLTTIHHIVSDGWSMEVLNREVAVLYEAFSQGHPSSLAELPVQYSDYALWQRERLQGEALEREIAYWRERLRGVPPLLELPTDRPRQTRRSSRGSSRALALSSGLSQELRTLSRRSGATLFMTLLAGFEALLFRVSGFSDFCVGTPVAGRTRVELEGLIGFFVNTLVLRANLSGRPGLRVLVARVREVAVDAQAHQDLPFDRLVEELQPSRSLSHSPLFQVMFDLQHLPARVGVEGLAGRGIAVEAGTSKFDLGLGFADSGGALLGGAEYAADLFDGVTVSRLLEQLRSLLSAAVADPERSVTELPLLSEVEAHQLLREWNDTAALPEEICLHELIERQAARTPEAAALVFRGETLSYREVNDRAGRLAGLLRGRGVGRGALVGLCLERSVELVTGLIAVLKAGAAYVPLDPEYPADRLESMIEDSGMTLVLTQSHLLARLPAGRVDVLCVDAEAGRGLPESGESPMREGGPDDVAYVIYTSGSTGRPKGVLVRHGAASRVVSFSIERFGLDAGDRVLQLASLSFDASVLEIWAALGSGAALHLLDQQTRLSMSSLADRLDGEGITFIALPPSLLDAIPWRELTALRTILVGGEACPRETVERWSVGHDFYNAYGPTETAIYSLLMPCPAATEETPPIGRPIAGVEAHLLDASLRPVPIGAAGELCIGGPGLAMGYLGRPDLTAGAFVPHPATSRPGERLYRTGDLARRRPDGVIDFLGRIDQQVKVRGFRVELGEIEAVLSRCPGVREVVVLARGDGQMYRTITGYVVPEEPGRLPPVTELRRFVAERLPDYMVPAAFVTLEALPLTPNGKVDRRALAAIGPERTEGEGYVAPRRLTEELLAELWSEVLGIERVGARDGFFELGGHSLLATRLVSRVRESFGVELPVRSVFESPTLESMGAEIDELLRAGRAGAMPPLVASSRGEAIPLSFAQERLWFIDQLAPGNPVYNLPLAVRLEGALEIPALAASLAEVVRRHEALRTVFEMRAGVPAQVVLPFAPPPLPVVDLGGLAEVPRTREARRLAGEESRRPFDLARGPLLRAALLRLGERDHAVLATLHHIAADGWSMQVFQREVFLLYEAARAGRAAALPELPVQYADYSRWQREWLSGETLESEIDHWRKRLRGVPPLLELPWDRPRPPVQSFRGASRSLVLSGRLTRSLQALGRREGATLFMVLLAGLEALLGRWARQTEFCVGTSVAGRTRLELESLIGFFVNTLVLRGDLSGEPGGRELLGRVREVCIDAHAHQELPFERLVEALAPERSLAHTPLFQVMLVLQSLPRATETLSELASSPLGMRGTAAKFDLTFNLSEGPGGLVGEIELDSDLFDGTTISRLARHLESLLEGLAADPERRLSELPLLSQTEVHQAAREWNDSTAEVRTELCLHELFEAQVDRNGEAVALSYGAERVSYSELELRANRIARWLRKRGVGPEVRVGVYLERTPDLVAALLGVLKAGGVYVPLDTAAPQERLSYQVADAAPRLLLISLELFQQMPEAGLAEVVCLDLENAAIDRESGDRMSSGVTSEGLAYLIYTSGSTGRPKAVLVEHRGVPNVAAAQGAVMGVQEGDRVLQLASLGFDASVFEMIMALGSGATLFLADRDSLLPGEGLVRLLREEEISHLTITPSALAVLPEVALPALRCLVVAGEACPAELVERWAPGRRFFNAYGPTEATIWATVERCVAGGAGPPLVGRPIPNVRVYCLDDGLRPVLSGAAGELCIGGAQVVRGYLGQPDLTADKFLPDPFGVPGSRLYRTGDLARFRPDGRLEFLGRVDGQVKIRGFRIEPGEIEAALRGHPEIRDAVVAAQQDGRGERSLTAWVVPVPGCAVSGAELRRYLAERLPEPMVPSAVVFLEDLPRTPSGKVDRRALPAPDRAVLASELSIPPRNETELLLAEIWEEVLDVRPVGVTTSFFDLGGHSLLAVRLMACIRERTGCDLPLTSLFQNGTIERLASLLSSHREPSRRAAVVPMRIAEGDRRPLFLLHPVGGNVLCYAELARRLGTERSIYGIQVPGPDGRPSALQLEEIAARYLDAVREVQPAGPYALAGWSMGGVLAYEMARQLRQAGDEGTLLAVIDALAPSPGGAPTPPMDEGEVLRGFAGDLAGLMGGAAGGLPEIAEAGGMELKDLFALGRDRGLLPPDIDFETVVRLFEMFRINLRAVEAYAGEPYSGPVLALLSEQAGSTDGGWGELVSGSVERHHLPGDHYSILREPGLDRLTEILGNSLRNWDLE